MTLYAYLDFAATHRRFVAFGFLMAFASSFGQTYVIGIFGPSVQAAFDLSHTRWGGIYMVGTLASAVVLPWTGKLIDHLVLARYTLGAFALLIAACVSMSLTTGAAMLVVTIFLLRQAGQGVVSHIAITSMARHFTAGRGRAIAIAALGYSTGEALLPFVAVLAIAAVGWRWTYAGAALLLAVAFVPAALWLLSDRGGPARASSGTSDAAAAVGNRSWTRAEVLRDARFYLLLPGVLAPSLILTGMFFHHLTLADAKGWAQAWITGSYGIYAAAAVVTSLTAGTLVDRLGAVMLVPFVLLPLAGAMAVVSLFDNPWSAWPYLALAGVSAGVTHTAVSALWAELYGAANLGAIRSLVTALGVLATALGPVFMGLLMDGGMSIEHVCMLFAAGTVACSGILTVASRMPRPPSPGAAP